MRNFDQPIHNSFAHTLANECKYQQKVTSPLYSTNSAVLAAKVLGGVIKEWKLGVAKQGLRKSGDPNVWKVRVVAGH